MPLKTKKIVITGGPSTGKTAVIKQLQKEGFPCLHEVIRSMTSAEKDSTENIKIVSNPIVSVSDPKKFNTDILEARKEQFRVSVERKDPLIFFDRGIPDVLGYMDCFGQSYGTYFESACQDFRYDQVFIMPPWKEIHVPDEERYESFEESERIHECLVTVYKRYSYAPIAVPFGAIAERTKFIVDQVNS